jgi:hypothetical protein
MKAIARVLLLVIGLAAPATAGQAQSLEVIGYAGDLGEWELTATVMEKMSSLTKEYAGPLTMTHVGICSQEGPEQKTGEIRIQKESALSSRLNATLSVDGVACTYSGTLSDSYTGMMNCADQRAILLKLWLK